MGLSDIRTDTEFAATIAVPIADIEQSNMDLVRYKKDNLARDLGMKIVEKKGWQDEHESGGLHIAELRLRVFTPSELMIYMNAKFKERLQHMAATEGYLTDHQREALMIQSERF